MKDKNNNINLKLVYIVCIILLSISTYYNHNEIKICIPLYNEGIATATDQFTIDLYTQAINRLYFTRMFNYLGLFCFVSLLFLPQITLFVVKIFKLFTSKKNTVEREEAIK